MSGRTKISKPGEVNDYASHTWYGMQGEGRNVWEAALDRIRHVYDVFDHVHVQFSGGKDSTATLHAALEVAAERDRLPLRVVHFDEECISIETEEYVRRVGERDDVALEWYCLPVRHRNACSTSSPSWWPWAPEAKELWGRPMPPEAITELAGFEFWPQEERLSIPDASPLLCPLEQYGRSCALLGIRAEESMVRRRAVSNHRRENWVIGTPVKHYAKAYPIYDWTTADVWTAPAEMGWDYNCNPAEAPIWMGDFSFRSIAKVQPGDEVIGWATSDGERARLVRATVLACGGKRAEVVKVTLASGRVIRCTPDHLWALRSCRPEQYLPAAIGRDLMHVVEPTGEVPAELTREAAWLGGIYDGEGCGDRIYQSPTHNPDVYARIGDVLAALDLPHVRLNDRSAAQHGYRVTGGRQGLVDLLNLTGAIRRGKNVDERVLTGRFRSADKVIAIEPDGTDEVYWLETTTGNYVAWGYASKNSTYDLMEMAGIPHFGQRCAPPFGEEPMQLLWMWASCFPDLWDRMCDRVPGARAAARYSRTELYAFKEKPEKPAGMSWQAFIRSLIDSHDAEVRPWLARHVQKAIGRHYRKTSEPIMPTAKHPDSGLCWEWLAMVALRGDFKERKQMMEMAGVGTAEGRVRARMNYDRQRAEVDADEAKRAEVYG